MVSGLFMNGLMMVNLYMDNECALLTYCRILVVLLGAQWITLVIVLAGMFVCWGLAQFNSKNYRPALNVALVLPAIAIGFWGQMLPIVWMTGSKTLNNAIPVAVSDSNKMQPLTMATTKDSIGGNSSTNPLSSKILPERFDLLFDEAVPLLGVQFLMALILGVMLIANLARYIRWSKKMTVDDFIGGRRAPRLIVSDSIQLLVGNFALIGVALVFYLAWHELNGQSYRETWLGTVLAEANKYAMGALVPIGGILVLSIHYLRPALDIILDVVNHFYFRPATDPDENENKNEDFDIVEVSFDSEQLYFSRRDAIHRRLKRILEYYRSTIEGRPALTVISHSQGSMVAIEVFNDNELAWVNEKFSQVNFITMGSPFHHIYQNYFGHLYPSIDNRFWDNLRSRVGRWLNIFRIDDYVGTDIEFPETLREVHRGDYSNHAVEQKGHQLYWCDRQVLSIMREHRICRSLSAGLNDETRKAA